MFVYAEINGFLIEEIFPFPLLKMNKEILNCFLLLNRFSINN
jgi:hypothetical protein